MHKHYEDHLDTGHAWTTALAVIENVFAFQVLQVTTSNKASGAANLQIFIHTLTTEFRECTVFQK